jgi:hypothetical protein
MPPPDRGDAPRDTSPLTTAGLTEDSRLWHNAARLTSWLEFLFHPEEHDYDRTVIYPDGTKREEPGRVTIANQTPGQYEPVDRRFESVLAGYQPWQFLHGIAAVARPQVERGDSPLGMGTVVLNNIWWLGDEGVSSLVDRFSTVGWDSAAAGAAYDFLLRLQTVTGQVSKLVQELYVVIPKYAVIVKRVRDNLDEAAASTVDAFEKKFAEKPESAFSVDVAGAIIAGVAAAAVTVMTGPIGASFVLESAAMSMWSSVFADVAKGAVAAAAEDDEVGGYWWRDLAKSYLHNQEKIMTQAKGEIEQLNRTVEGLVGKFSSDPNIKEFIQLYGGG